MLNHTQIELVRSTWNMVVPIGDQAAALFYKHLFEAQPELQGMFAHTDMASQRTKLLAALALVVRSLDKIEDVLPALQGLGRGHLAYGVREEHYTMVGTALLKTLGVGLGDQFTAEVREAWTLAYHVIAGVMIEAARRHQAVA